MRKKIGSEKKKRIKIWAAGEKRVAREGSGEGVAGGDLQTLEVPAGYEGTKERFFRTAGSDSGP